MIKLLQKEKNSDAYEIKRICLIGTWSILLEVMYPQKDFLNKKWYATDCCDAGGANEVRLAKYFDVKGNLFCENRQTQMKSLQS